MTKKSKEHVVWLVNAESLADNKKAFDTFKKEVLTVFKRQSYSLIGSYPVCWKAYRWVYAETASEKEVAWLRKEVDKAIKTNNHIIITPYQVNWNELC